MKSYIYWILPIITFLLGFAVAGVLTLVAINKHECVLVDLNYLEQDLSKSTKRIDNSSRNTFQFLQRSVSKNILGQDFYNKASELHAYSEQFVQMVTHFQKDLKSDPVNSDNTREQLDRALEFMNKFKSQSEQLFKGHEVEQSMFLSAWPDTDRIFPLGLLGKDVDTNDYWDQQLALVYLEKIKSDAKLVTLVGVEILQNMISKEEIIYDSFNLQIIPSSRMVKLGEEFSADIFLAASSSMVKPLVTVNGKGCPVNPSGFVNFVSVANEIGEKTVNAKISYKDGFGEDRTVSRQITYEVVP